MNDLFSTRRNRRPPVVIAGTVIFALLALAISADALRGVAPLAAEGGLAARDALPYRAGAALLCAGIAAWIFVAGGPRRDDRPSLLK